MAYERMTDCGPIRGRDCRLPGIQSFRGIRYARAGRWEFPMEVTGWEGTYDATEYGACSYQPRAFANEAENPGKVFYYNEFRKDEVYTYSEDCLFLNIWTPEEATESSRLPVIFYIHGGGFTGGCGHEKHFDGPVWPTLGKGAVAVTINYRLGPMGFVTLPELKEEAGHTGNYGLYDQLTALQWVRHNIKAFGGDPENITLMGQSAGAMSIQQFLLSSLPHGLYARAFMSSGAGAISFLDAKKSEDNYAFWLAVEKEAGCRNLEEFRQIDPEKLFAAWETVKKTMKGSHCFPTEDGDFVTGKASKKVRQGEMEDLPLMVGTNSQDIFPPVFYSMAGKLGKKAAYWKHQPVYQYFFDRQLPGDDCGAWHSADLWYWFGTYENCWRPFGEKDFQLSENMTEALYRFVTENAPGRVGDADWLPIGKKNKKVLILGEEAPKMGKAPMGQLVKTLLTSKSVGE